MGLSQGAAGLFQRIQPYLSLTDGSVFDLTQLGEETAPWSDTVEKLTSAEHVLSKMMEAIAGDNASASPGGYEDEDDNDSAYSRESASVDSHDEAPDQTYNVRIKSKRFMRDLENDDDYLSPGKDIDKDNNKDDSANISAVVDVIATEHEIPSRLAVKKISARRATEEKRKEEMAARRKKLLDKMESKGKAAAAAGAEIIDSEFKAQKAAADR